MPPACFFTSENLTLFSCSMVDLNYSSPDAYEKNKHHHEDGVYFLVREAGLEPARPEWTLEPESSESANSTTRANVAQCSNNIPQGFSLVNHFFVICHTFLQKSSRPSGGSFPYWFNVRISGYTPYGESAAYMQDGKFFRLSALPPYGAHTSRSHALLQTEA